MSHGLETDRGITREQLLELRDAPVHVVGAASAEGVAVLRLLGRLGFTDLTVHDVRERAVLRTAFRTTHGAYDRREQDELWEALQPVLDRGRFGEQYLSGMAGAALVVLGQGWYLEDDNRRRLVEAVPAGARITGMSELYAALHRGPIAAVTGTNGKSTTVALVEHLLEAGGVEHRTSGNERSSCQFLPEVDELPDSTLALLEVSNRQLLQLSRSPHVAAITALTPDHLEEHGGLAGYREAKARLFTRQEPCDVAIANADDPLALAAAEQSPAAAAGRLVRCGTGAHEGPSVAWDGDELWAVDVPVHPRLWDLVVRDPEPVHAPVASREDLRLPGEHNRRNAAVAVATALACGVPASAIAPALRSFAGKSLRLEQLDVVDGVEVWSDLKSTTPKSTIAALDALAGRSIRLIAGGDDKGLDYAPLAAAIVAARVRVLAVPGSATDALASELGRIPGGTASIELVDALATALDRAFGTAASGDVVIVSPAAAGFWTRQLQGGASLRSMVRRRARALQEVSER